MAGTEVTWPEHKDPAESVPAHHHRHCPLAAGMSAQVLGPPAEKQHHLSRCTMLFAMSQEFCQSKPSSLWKSSFLGTLQAGFLLWCPPVHSAGDRNHPTHEMSASPFCQKAKVKGKENKPTASKNPHQNPTPPTTSFSASSLRQLTLVLRLELS